MILCVCPNPAIDKLVYIDNFRAAKVNRISSEYSYPGGKGVHVALGIKELGEEVSLLSIWGGPTGEWIKQQCEAKGIVCYGPKVKNWSRTCLSIKSQNNFNETELLGSGLKISISEYDSFIRDYEKLLKKADVVSMSGSWPKNSFNANYSPLIKKASLLNIKSFVDCSGSILISALKKKPFAVHINHYESYDIFKSNNFIEASLKLSNHCDIAATTYGEKGLYLYDGNKIVHAVSKVTKVISTVGSGDSLMAGLIVANKRNYTLIETAKLAASTGAANCMRKELGMFYKKDVEQLFENCEIDVKLFPKREKDND